MDTAWAVILFLAAALLVGSPAVLTLRRPDYRFAEVCLVVSAILVGAWCWVWMYMTDTPQWIRILIGLLVGTFCFVVVPEGIRLIRAEKNHAEGDETLKAQ